MANSSFTGNEAKFNYLVFVAGKEHRHSQTHTQQTPDIMLICGNLAMNSNLYRLADECSGLWALAFVILTCASV